MRTFESLGSWTAAAVAALVLVAGGCGSDDDQAAAPPPIAGEYAATVDISGGETAEVEMVVDADGEAEGVVLLPADAAGAATLSGIVVISVGVEGFVDPDTGAFDLSGSFAGTGGPVDVRLTGVLPAAGRNGSVDLQIGDETYSAPLVAVGVPTPVFTPTSVPGASTPTPTTGTGPTNTPGNNTGVSPDMLRTWRGEARNDSTGTRLDARLRIEASGSNVVVTDLNGNIFPGGNQVTMTVQSPTVLSYNDFGPPVVVFTLDLTSPTTLVGLHGVTSVSFPPTTTSLALNLTPEN